MAERTTKDKNQEQDAIYRPRRVPRYSDLDQDIDGEDVKYNFKIQGHIQEPMETMAELHGAHGRLADEFHNSEFEKRHPEMVQPTHYDHYDPQVEGFYGPGYSFEP